MLSISQVIIPVYMVEVHKDDHLLLYKQEDEVWEIYILVFHMEDSLRIYPYPCFYYKILIEPVIVAILKWLSVKHVRNT